MGQEMICYDCGKPIPQEATNYYQRSHEQTNTWLRVMLREQRFYIIAGRNAFHAGCYLD